MSRQGYIQITRECDQDCRFCSNPPNENKIDLLKGKELIDRFVEEEYTGIIFTGGEPTLSPLLPDLLAYAGERGMPSRIITNAQKMSDPEFFKTLYGAGLRNVNISIYSARPDVQSFLTGNPDSFVNIRKAIEIIAAHPDMQLVLNTVINRYNADHLSENIEWALREAPFVRHFVWNNLDPRNSKVARNPETVARLNDFQLELHKAVNRLLQTGRTCRIERVPLCYMAGFEHLSTETRKIVNEDKAATYFLDEKGLFSQESPTYGKAECCAACTLDSICAGLFEMDVHYFSEELYACFIDREAVVRRILDPDGATESRLSAARKV